MKSVAVHVHKDDCNYEISTYLLIAIWDIRLLSLIILVALLVEVQLRRLFRKNRQTRLAEEFVTAHGDALEPLS